MQDARKKGVIFDDLREPDEHIVTQHLDELDRRIIAILRGDGRAPIAKMASMLQVSRAAVQARLDRLLDTGMILGFAVRVQEPGGADALRAVMLIEVAGRSTAIIRRLRSFREIRALHTTNGGWDLVAEIVAEGRQGFDRILCEIRAIEGILNSDQYPAEQRVRPGRINAPAAGACRTLRGPETA